MNQEQNPKSFNIDCRFVLWDKEFNLDCIYIFIKNKTTKDFNFLFIKKLVIIRGIPMLSKLIDWFSTQ